MLNRPRGGMKAILESNRVLVMNIQLRKVSESTPNDLVICISFEKSNLYILCIQTEKLKQNKTKKKDEEEEEERKTLIDF